MTTLPERKSSHPENSPDLMSPQLDTTLRVLLNKLEPAGTGKTIMPGVRTPQMKTDLQAHLDHLVVKGQPIARDRLDERLSVLFIGYPQMRSWSDDEVEAFTARCMASLQPYPEWVIAKIFRPERLHRDIANTQFPPTADTLATMADAEMVRYRLERHRIETVLNAIDPSELPPETPEHRAAVVERALARFREPLEPLGPA